MKVLVAEDNEVDRKVLTALLKAAGYEALDAASGEDCLRIVTEEKPGIVILDVEMEGLSGNQVLIHLRETYSSAQLPIIMVTGKAKNEDILQSLRLGANDYLTKPVNFEIARMRIEIQAKLVEYISRHAQLERELEETNAKLLELSVKDPLTGLYNRRFFAEAIDREWKSSFRSDQPLSLLMIDVDYFKKFNDHYGHAAGDTCLKKVGRALQASVGRPYDIVARYGGEEFVIVLGGADLKGAAHVANKVRDCVVALNIQHEGSPIHRIVTVSIGVASHRPKTGGTAAELLERSDRGLYQAKEAGRNQIGMA